MIVKMLQDKSFNLNFYIPNSLIKENFDKAHRRNALMEEKFHFRTNIFDSGPPEIK